MLIALVPTYTLQTILNKSNNKQMKTYNVLIGFYLIMLMSCSQKPEKSLFIDFNLAKTQELPLSDFVDSINYIPLKADFIFDNITDIKYGKNHIFIQVPKHGVLKFSKDGTFQNKIGAIGRGPSEYSKLISFDINEKDEEVYVLLHIEKKLMTYNFDGDCLRTDNIEAEHSFCCVNYMNNNLLMLGMSNVYGAAPFNWLVTDTRGNLIDTKPNSIHFTLKEYSGIIPSFCTWKSGDGVNFYDQYNDTIFFISNSGYRVKHIFPNDEYRLTPKRFMEGFGIFPCYIPRKISESERYIFIQYTFNEQKLLGVLEKSTSNFTKVSNSIRGEFTNEMNGGPGFFPQFIYKDKIAIDWMNSFELIQFLEANKNKGTKEYDEQHKKKLDKLANSIGVNDNPILMVVKFSD